MKNKKLKTGTVLLAVAIAVLIVYNLVYHYDDILRGFRDGWNLN